MPTKRRKRRLFFLKNFIGDFIAAFMGASVFGVKSTLILRYFNSFYFIRFGVHKPVQKRDTMKELRGKPTSGFPLSLSFVNRIPSFFVGSVYI